MTETWLSAKIDEPKTVELAPCAFYVKSFPRQSRSHGHRIAMMYKSNLGSSITFKTNIDFTYTLVKVVLASVTIQHNTLHFFSLYSIFHPTDKTILLTMFTEQLSDLLDYIDNLPGLVCLGGDMNINFDNPQQSATKQTFPTLNLCSLVQVINEPTNKCGHIINWVVVRPDNDINRSLLLQTHLNQTTIALNPTLIFQSLCLLPHTRLLGT